MGVCTIIWVNQKNVYWIINRHISATNHTQSVSLSNQKSKTQPTMINLHPNEYIQELHYYPFKVNVDICVGSCHTLNDLSNKVCVPNKTEDLILKHVQHDCRNK